MAGQKNDLAPANLRQTYAVFLKDSKFNDTLEIISESGSRSQSRLVSPYLPGFNRRQQKNNASTLLVTEFPTSRVSEFLRAVLITMGSQCRRRAAIGAGFERNYW